MESFLLAALVGLVNGLLLGLVGGGGSILAVPALVYLLDQKVGPATTISLIVVGLNAAYGALRQRRRNAGLVRFDYALALGATGLVGVQAGNWLNHNLPDRLLLAGFSLLMLVVALTMLQPPRLGRVESAPKPIPALRQNWIKVGLSGLGLGFLTGLFGVGGGFLIVPVLVLLLRFPIRVAASTSLVVIALNSFSALAGRWPLGGFEGWLVAILLGTGLVGLTFGSKLADRLPEKTLRQVFAWLIVAIALYMGYRAFT